MHTVFKFSIAQLLENRITQAILIIVIAVVLAKVLSKLISSAIHKKDMTNRLETLARVFSKVLTVVIYFFAALQLCQVIFNIQPTSVIAATGVIGVAIGFGAQSIVKDVISGFFILIENQFAVGESVTVEGFTGTVSELTLRSTIIRAANGDLFTIPNGSISKVTNHSRCNRGVTVAVEIAYEEDIDNALEVMKRVAEEAKKDMESITKIPDVLGVSALGSSGVELKMLATCVPGEQFAVERELLKRVKYAFDKEGIDIPYNHIVIVNKENTK